MKEKENNEYKEIKTILLGEHGVGKTNLINTAIGLKFNENLQSTISSSFVRKEFFLNNKNYLMKIWDTAGMEKYRSLNKLFYKKSKIIIFVYDITRKKSFDELEFWTKEIEENIKNDHVIGIIGNKIDLFEKEEVDEFQAREYTKNKNGNFKLVSAKENPKAFISFLSDMLYHYVKIKENKKKQKNNLGKTQKVNLNKKKAKNKGGCCK